MTNYLINSVGVTELTALQYNCLEVAIDHLIDHLEEVCTEERDYRNVDVELEAARGLKNILRAEARGAVVGEEQ